MPSIYTDSVREERYGRLRVRKKQLEKYYDILGWILLIGMGGGLIAAAIGAFLTGIFLDPMELIRFIPEAGQVFIVFWALYRHDPKCTGLAMLIFFGCGALSSLLSGTGVGVNGIGFALNLGFLPLIIILLIDFKWDKLRKEEGFPHFDILYEEREKRQQNQEELSRNRALKAGVRVAATEQTSEMGDLLDAGFDAPVMAPHLHGIHDRGQFAVGGIRKPDAYTEGQMDRLEEIGAPENNTEMEEL